MKMRIERDLPILLFILVSLSAFTSLPQVESTWSGVKEVYGEQDFGLRILREAMLVVVVAYSAFQPQFWRGALTGKVFALLGLLASYALFEVGYALYLDLPLVVPLAGLRVFEYLPLALIGFVMGKLGAGDQALARFVLYLRYYVTFQAALAIAQALWAPQLHGVSLLGGGRPFGTFASPNLFGTAMATCTLFFSLAQAPGMRKWLYACVFLALLSGSRTALLSSLLVVFFRAYSATRARDRWALILPAPILAVGALLVASSPLLSGRDDANPTEDGRITLWRKMLGDNINDLPDLLFGWGLGLGSNTINILYGADYFPGQFDSDSLYLFLLNGYGLIGLLAYLLFVWLSARMSAYPKKGLVMTFIFVIGLPFNVWEYFPLNAMLMFLWGVVLGTSRSLGLKQQTKVMASFGFGFQGGEPAIRSRERGGVVMRLGMQPCATQLPRGRNGSTENAGGEGFELG